MGIGAISISCGAVNGATNKGLSSLFGGMAINAKKGPATAQTVQTLID